jgi:hypothetical protein
MRAASLESSLAAEEMNTYKQRAHYEGECVRHQATMRRNGVLTEVCSKYGKFYIRIQFDNVLFAFRSKLSHV